MIFAIYFGYELLGFYGVSLAGMGMLTTTGLIVSMDSYGPIADNAQGIAQLSKLKGKANAILAMRLRRLTGLDERVRSLEAIEALVQPVERGADSRRPTGDERVEADNGR